MWLDEACRRLAANDPSLLELELVGERRGRGKEEKRMVAKKEL